MKPMAGASVLRRHDMSAQGLGMRSVALIMAVPLATYTSARG
jgi:hypothetical protein